MVEEHPGEDVLRSLHQMALREASGKITSEDPMVSFLYLLIRDHVPPGVVGDVHQQVKLRTHESSVFTNGWLAQYASYVVNDLCKHK